MVGVRWLIQLPGSIMILCVRFYQVCLSPLIPPMCIYRPSCSQYFIEAVKKYGAIRGGFKGVKRICRCHPWGKGGEDPP
jgi:putative membrane protein insertion efficiency factor